MHAQGRPGSWFTDAILCLSNQCQRHGRRAQVTGLAGTGTTDRHESGSSEDEDADGALRMFNYGYNNAGSTALGLQSGNAGEEEVSRGGGSATAVFPSAAPSSWGSASSPAGSNVDRHASVCLLLFAVDMACFAFRVTLHALLVGPVLLPCGVWVASLFKSALFTLAALLTLSTMFVLSPVVSTLSYMGMVFAFASLSMVSGKHAHDTALLAASGICVAMACATKAHIHVSGRGVNISR